MIRTRTIHSDRTTSYRINLDGREQSEDLVIRVFDESGITLFEKTIPASKLYGVSDLHFKYQRGVVVWDGKSAPIVE